MKNRVVSSKALSAAFLIDKCCSLIEQIATSSDRPEELEDIVSSLRKHENLLFELSKKCKPVFEVVK